MPITHSVLDPLHQHQLIRPTHTDVTRPRHGRLRPRRLHVDFSRNRFENNSLQRFTVSPKGCQSSRFASYGRCGNSHIASSPQAYWSRADGRHHRSDVPTEDSNSPLETHSTAGVFPDPAFVTSGNLSTARPKLPGALESELQAPTANGGRSSACATSGTDREERLWMSMYYLGGPGRGTAIAATPITACSLGRPEYGVAPGQSSIGFVSHPS